MLRHYALLASLVLLLAVAGCGAGSDVAGIMDPSPTTPEPPTSPEPPPTPTPPPPTGTSMSDAEVVLALAVLDLVNVERQKAGLDPVSWDDQAAEVAYAHSVDMDVRGYFDHTNPDGQKPWDRLSAAGVSWSTAGENIAMGYPSPEAVMAAWMNSPGHRDNILRAGFQRLGIGVHDNGSIWWTQLFYTP